MSSSAAPFACESRCVKQNPSVALKTLDIAFVASLVPSYALVHTLIGHSHGTIGMSVMEFAVQPPFAVEQMASLPWEYKAHWVELRAMLLQNS